MTTEQKARILRVLQEKYEILPGWYICEDGTINQNTFEARGEVHYKNDFDHGLVFDALDVWIFQLRKDGTIKFRAKKWMFHIKCPVERLSWRVYGGTLSERLWKTVEYILTQKGEL